MHLSYTDRRHHERRQEVVQREQTRNQKTLEQLPYVLSNLKHNTTTMSIKNITIMGGTGQIGRVILDALVATQKFNISAVSREESSATFPTGVAVKKGDYSNDSFLVEALKGQDVLIMALSFQSPPELQTRMIKAAAEVGVAYVLPNEFGSDNGHPIMRESVMVNAGKTQYRDQVEQLGKSSWIGIVNNPWYDYVSRLQLFLKLQLIVAVSVWWLLWYRHQESFRYLVR